MKTASEVAEEIWQELWNLPPHSDTDIFVKALTTFANNQVAEDRANRTVDEMYRASYEQGLEDAAKVIDRDARTAIPNGYGWVGDRLEFLAKTIRSLKSKHKETS